VLVVVLVLAGVWGRAAATATKPLRSLTAATFDEEVHGSKAAFIKFFAPWCVAIQGGLSAFILVFPNDPWMLHAQVRALPAHQERIRCGGSHLRKSPQPGAMPSPRHMRTEISGRVVLVLLSPDKCAFTDRRRSRLRRTPLDL
jgi:hypothetical protein